MTRLRRLLIDDTREETSSNIQMRLDVIARNYWEGINQLKLNWPWDLLLIDHDISSFELLGGLSGKEWTGYDIMFWLEDPANEQYRPKKIVCVSSNPPGAKRIQMVIDKLYGGN